jgi:hypothetical protein
MAITTLPVPPNRADPVNFAARGDALLGALPVFVAEANALAADVSDKQGQASTNAIAAVGYASAALASRNAAGISSGEALASRNAASTSAGEALASRNAAGTSATTASDKAMIAVDKAASATASEANALASRNAASTSEGNATAAAAGALASKTASDTAAGIATAANVAAQAAANYKGIWSGLTGALNIPASVQHAGDFWVLMSSLANVTTAVPGVSASWVLMPASSLLPAAGKTPLAGPDGRISRNWIRQHSNDIGVAGAQGFGVGICPALPAGFSALAGSSDPASDNYGNYQYSDGSIMCWIPAFYYRYGSGANGTAVNIVEIKPVGTYATVLDANAAGYALHRAFYDGGAVQLGVMVDKYQVSNNGGIASSIKNGAPLSSASVHNPFSGLTGAPPNIYGSAFAVAKTRGANFFCNPRHVFAALALLSLAHGQASTGVAQCAWYDAGGTTNFPKGNNNNALKDSNDSAVTYTTDGYPNCGLTGSGAPFAKTTHNGQSCGIADLNGNLWEISPGLTCVATSKTITGATQANPCVLTVVGHGLATGALVQIRSNGSGMTQLHDRINTVTVIDADRISLDATDSSAFTAYTSGGSITAGTFYALKTSASMKSLTGGNALATDHWGAAGLAALFDVVVPNFSTIYPNNSIGQRFGNGTNQVLSGALSGSEWAMAGAGLPRTGGISPSGTNAFGVDQFYQFIQNEMCPLAGGNWSGGSLAGVWMLFLSYVRGTSSADVGCRAALYL